jgi:hypothetical protein
MASEKTRNEFEYFEGSTAFGKNSVISKLPIAAEWRNIRFCDYPQPCPTSYTTELFVLQD